MRRNFAVPLFVALVFAVFFGAKFFAGKIPAEKLPEKTAPVWKPEARITPGRIVSLAPSLTETLFALGLGDKVAGVTRYCNYPPEALKKPKVGGYDSPSFEALVALAPDLVVALPEHRPFEKRFRDLGIRVLWLDNKTIEGIMSSITSIGETCGVRENAARLVSGLRGRIEKVRRKAAAGKRPRVLVTIGRRMGSGSVKDVYAAGRKGFYNEMVELAGGVNAYRGGIAFPSLSRESVISLDPDVIFDMIPDLAENGLAEADFIARWRPLSGVKAVKNSRVYIIGDDYSVIPGPRFILILEKMARALDSVAGKPVNSGKEAKANG